MSGAPSDWESSKGIAKGILRNRAERRKLLGQGLLFTLGWLSTGLWILNGWLDAEIWRFVLWWGICCFLALGLMLFATYDSLASFREEREDR